MKPSAGPRAAETAEIEKVPGEASGDPAAPRSDHHHAAPPGMSRREPPDAGPGHSPATGFDTQLIASSVPRAPIFQGLSLAQVKNSR